MNLEVLNCLPAITLTSFSMSGGLLTFSGIRGVRADVQGSNIKISLGLILIAVGFILYNVVLAAVDTLRTGAF